ncbi:MAG TPA: hypothetical protein VEC11_05300 [Allosphingosinicella sp.]|nr:hypothetical protein [Allosphingosinicella sp.]
MNDTNRTRVIIAAMAGVIVILVVVIAFMLGRNSATPAAAPANRVAAAPAAPARPVNQTAAAPAPAGDTDDALARWLAGGWAEASTNCLTDTGDFYDPSGRYGSFGREGIWRIEDGVLVVTVTHEAVGDPMASEYIGLPNPEITRSRITREGEEYMIQEIGGRSVRMRRCPQAHHSFAT